MKKRIFMLIPLLAFTLAMSAVPAKKGLWKTLKLADGTEVSAQLSGDEHGHYWVDANGVAYKEIDGSDVFQSADVAEITYRAGVRRSRMAAKSAVKRKVTMGQQTHYLGEKKGLVILMNFTDTKFKTANNLAKYKDILNKENYKTGSFKGSVYDYFKAQSGGKFELVFDVVGPYTAEHDCAYYGKDVGGDGNDAAAEELIVEAVKAANSEVNFKDYDWDGDGEVDQVFILYAGKGQADGGSSNTIWPHMYYLDYMGKSLWLDGVKINTYACSNEIMPNGSIEGIGCFCHEFSHCMGFPDFYDTSYSGWFGMGDWDLMCSGSYNGNTFQPAGYTGYEKWMAGWLEPIELKTDQKVENLKAISNEGEAYIIYNDKYRNEYYMIENRQKTGWDASLPGNGLMITHVDFDQEIWEENAPNTKITTADFAMGYTKTNDHQRFTIFRANNKTDEYSYSSDLYPYNGNDSLTKTSKPAATLYNKNSAGTKFMQKGITKITQNSDGTMSFVYGNPDGSVTPVVPVDPTEEGTLLYETFDLCDGKGGNDGMWSGAIANSTLTTDVQGWTAAEDKAFGANKCAKFGTGSVAGNASTPTFIIDGSAKLTFRAGCWNGTNDDTTLYLSVTDGTVSPAEVTMTKSAFNTYEATISAKGEARVTFYTSKGRFFLDDVLVKAETTTTGIAELKPAAVKDATRIYTLDGRFMGTSLQQLPRGLYIVNGRKIVR